MVILVPKNNKYPFLYKVLVLKIWHNILIIFTQFLVRKKLIKRCKIIKFVSSIQWSVVILCLWSAVSGGTEVPVMMIWFLYFLIWNQFLQKTSTEWINTVSHIIFFIKVSWVSTILISAPYNNIKPKLLEIEFPVIKKKHYLIEPV